MFTLTFGILRYPSVRHGGTLRPEAESKHAFGWYLIRSSLEFDCDVLIWCKQSAAKKLESTWYI